MLETWGTILCENGRNTLKKCPDCNVKAWVASGQKLNHVAGNPKRAEFAKIVNRFRQKRDSNFVSTYYDFKESIINSPRFKDYFSMFIGNFESKDLHTIK